MPCELMDGRSDFLDFSKERNLEFSSLRRCKFSTQALLYELHHPTLLPVQDKIVDSDRYSAIQRCIRALVHACHCQDANCQNPSCHKMKRVVSHVRQCKRKSTGGCPICKQFIALCCYHAKVCQDAECKVHWCQKIQKKLKEGKSQQRYV